MPIGVTINKNQSAKQFLNAEFVTMKSQYAIKKLGDVVSYLVCFLPRVL